MHNPKIATSSPTHNTSHDNSEERFYPPVQVVPEELLAPDWHILVQAFGIGVRVTIWLIIFSALLLGLFTYPAILVGVFLFVALYVQ